MTDYRIVKTWDDRHTLQEWSAYNFDGIIDNMWWDRQTFDDLGHAIDAVFAARGEAMPELFYLAHEYDDKVVTVHNTFDDANEYASRRGLRRELRDGVEIIYEFGGAWDAFRRCEFCDEFFPYQELNESGYCEHCEWYVTKGRC